MSFIFSNFLWLLPLISLPIIFHLLNKRNHKNITFSTLKFFNSIQSDAIRKISIINILLLAIRTLIIFSIIMILSRPVYKTFNGTLPKTISDNLYAIIIDDSPSNQIYFNKYFSKLITKIKNIYVDDTHFQIYTLNNGKLLYDGRLSNLNTNNLKYDILVISEIYYLGIYFDTNN